LFDFDIFWPNPIALVRLPDVEGTPLHLSSTLGQLIPFDRSPHMHAAYLAALALFEPGTLASLHPRSLAKLLHAVHPHMVSLLTNDFFVILFLTIS